MKRNKLKLQQSDSGAPERPKRAKSIMPTSMRHPEMVPNQTEEQEPSNTPGSSVQNRTEPPKKRPTFDQRYRRVTTYIEYGLDERLRRVALESAEVRTITRLLNEALREYLTTHFPHS